MPETPGLKPGRVASVYSALVDLWTEDGPKLAAIRGRARRALGQLPAGGIAVGDWVAVAPVGDEVVVEHVLPRRTVFMRQAAGERVEPQAIAANIDRVFVMTSLEGDFNLRRLERYLVAIRAGGAEASILLGKADLSENPSEQLAAANALAPSLLISSRTGMGIDALRAQIPKGSTVALAGSSGVGKSALVNHLLGQASQLEGEVREYDKRGRHTTTRRSLFVVPGGGLLVDTPGMRELKPWVPEAADGEAESDDEESFADIAELAASCRYRDCGHEREPGCAVRAAVEAGKLDGARVESWKKLERERAASAVARVEDRRRRRR